VPSCRLPNRLLTPHAHRATCAVASWRHSSSSGVPSKRRVAGSNPARGASNSHELPRVSLVTRRSRATGQRAWSRGGVVRGRPHRRGEDAGRSRTRGFEVVRVDVQWQLRPRPRAGPGRISALAHRGSLQCPFRRPRAERKTRPVARRTAVAGSGTGASAQEVKSPAKPKPPC